MICAALVAGAALAQKPPVSQKATAMRSGQGGMMQRGPGGPGGGRGRFMEQLVKELGLNPGQKAKVEALMKKQGDKSRAAFQKLGLKPGTRPTEVQMKSMMALRTKSQAEMDAEMKKILNAAQYKKYTALRAKREAEMKKRMQQGGGMMRGPGGGGPARAGGGGH